MSREWLLRCRHLVELSGFIPQIKLLSVSKNLSKQCLEDCRELGISYDWYWRLAEATPEQLNNWHLIAGVQGIFWEDLDEDLSVLGLLEGRRSVKS